MTARFAEAAALVAVVVGLAVLVLAADDQSPPRIAAVGPPVAVPASKAEATHSALAGGQVSRPTDPPAGQAPEPEPKAAPPTTGMSPIVWVRNGRRVVLRDAPDGSPIGTSGDRTEFGSPSVFGVLRHTQHWVGVSTPLLPNGELAWIEADPDRLRGGYVDYSIVVDLSERSAELDQGGAKVSSWPVTVGAPGTETPTGRFAVTDTFRGGLSDAYGCCAVALTATQPDLPADWPGGDRIAFHGTNDPLGQAASHGCIRSADRDVSRLVDTVPLGTPVQIKP